MRQDGISRADAGTIEQLYPELRRFAGVVAPWDIDPDDVLHAALVAVLQTRSLADLDDPLRYIRRAIVNTVRNDQRRLIRGRTALVRVGPAGDDHPSYPSDMSDLAALEPLERAVVFLHDIEGLTFGQVAEATGIRTGHARVLASRARRKLRDRITEEDRL